MQAQPLLQTAGSEPTGRARHDMRPNRRCSTDAVMPSWPPKAAPASAMTTRISRYEPASSPRPSRARERMPASERSDKGQDGGNALRNRDLA